MDQTVILIRERKVRRLLAFLNPDVHPGVGKGRGKDPSGRDETEFQ
jgi:hypothetical protein